MSKCSICPRHCNIDRAISKGVCQMGEQPMLARAALHMWEEPCVSGTNGSGTVFFSGCNLRCVFCQNYSISHFNQGKVISVERLKDIFQELIQQGAHNINLVNPTHYTNAIIEALPKQLSVPVVYNCGGYESVETLKKLEGKIQVYLPDLKYSNNSLASKYSKACDYVETAKNAILEMYRQTGDYLIDENGMIQKGVIIRHLILPNQLENTFGVIDWVKDTFQEGQVLFSLMSQYTPFGELNKYPELKRKITKKELQIVEDYLFNSGIEDGFLQELSSSNEKYIPSFDCEGV